MHIIKKDTSNKVVERIKLEEIAYLINGYSFKKNDMLEKGEYPIIKIGNMVDGNVQILEGNSYSNKFIEKVKINNNDLLIGLSGANAGKSAVFSIDKTCLLNQRCLIVRAKKPEYQPVINFYVPYLIKRVVKQKVQNAAIPNLSSKEVGKIEFDVDFETALKNSLILKERKENLNIIQTLISKMEQRNQYYLHGLTSGELAIKDGSTFENDESINKVVLNGKTKRVPASFDEFKLGDIIQEENKSKLAVKDAIEGEYPFFNCSETLSMTHNDYLVDGNYIIMSTGGKPSIHYYEGKIAYSSDSYVISATDNVNSRYLAFLLTANMKRIERCFLGSGLKHLNKKIFKKEVYHLPDLDKQKEVADFLSKNEDEVNLVRELYSKEKQVFQWLCEKLVSGEYRIEE